VLHIKLADEGRVMLRYNALKFGLQKCAYKRYDSQKKNHATSWILTHSLLKGGALLVE